MIGSRGRAIDGMLLGLIVTFTHTFSVILLGIIAKILARSYSEQELHIWLGLASSLIILGVGLWMLRQRLFGHDRHHHFHLFGGSHHSHDHHHPHEKATDHAHDHNLDHTHDHHHHPHEHVHDNDHDHTAHPATQDSTRYNKWNLLLLGISGGLVPCPAAIATLLAAIGAGRIAQGLTLALFFSLGLGLVMMSIGVALSHAGRFTEKIGSNQEFSRRMGLASALIIVGIGSYTLYHSIQGLLS